MRLIIKSRKIKELEEIIQELEEENENFQIDIDLAWDSCNYHYEISENLKKLII